MTSNRRQFLKSLIAGVIGSTVNIDVESILSNTTNIPDEKWESYVTYMIYNFQLKVSNPAMCGYIDGITE